MTRTVTTLAIALALAACGKDDAKPADTGAALPAATAAPAGSSWTETFAATPEGGFRMGNPDAKVKLVEFASLTCPHCREFHEAGMETLKNKYVASGNVSYEFRNFVLNGPDFAASILARCQGPQTFFSLLGAFFADQQTWTQAFAAMSKAQQDELSRMPEEQAVTRMAELGGLDAYVRTRGMPRARFDQCLADPSIRKTLIALRDEATTKYNITGTPGFIINGTTQDGVFTWEQLEPKLQEALR